MMPAMLQNLTGQPRGRWAAIFWLMAVVTVAALAGMIYMAVQWERDDHRKNEWFDQMCAVRGGTYCEHQLPPVTLTGTP